MNTGEAVLARAEGSMGHATLYWIGRGGVDPTAPLPGQLTRVAPAWTSLDVPTQQEMKALALTIGIDVHDPNLVRAACDCSGFVCWALGFARKTALPNGFEEWTNSDSIWADAMGPQTRFYRVAKARPGALVVYPRKDSHERYGHVAIVVAADSQGNAKRIIHCSADNLYSAPHDAIKITTTEKFQRQHLSIYAWYRDVE